ncbi:MAG: OsmC family protein [Asgard group archaeon]|nr:OsmC family protein [Asgard group archaeon]
MNDENLHLYKVIIELVADREGKFLLEDPEKPVIHVATPPEFPGGKAGIHSPEDLFVGAVASCKMTTFCAMAEKLSLDFSDLRIAAVGYVGKSESRGLAFTKVTTKLTFSIKKEEDRNIAERCLDLTSRYCLVTNSLKTEVEMDYEISVLS